MIEWALDRGMNVSHDVRDAARVAAHAPLFGSLDEFGAALEARSRWGRVKRMLGFSPKVGPRPEAKVVLEFHAQFHGLEAELSTVESNIMEALERVGPIAWRSVDYHESMFMHRPKTPQTPIPEAGWWFFEVTSQVMVAIEKRDPERAFHHASRFVGLLKENPAVARLLLQGGQASFCDLNPRFGTRNTSAAALTMGVERDIRGWAKEGDLDALRQFFFARKAGEPLGVLPELLDRNHLATSVKEFYGEAWAQVFGETRNFSPLAREMLLLPWEGDALERATIRGRMRQCGVTDLGADWNGWSAIAAIDEIYPLPSPDSQDDDRPEGSLRSP